ncbi:hypothetical protein PSTT_01153 [Puccinia striiformis]|uniref:Uncharacterized protein n=1 Tax=Puccinia striiformis TaxID=27350 RepID=A0A2S4W4K6_9BASI|nr:hypothetical protein PSTT_01153 [Puccinia striiformis]
MMVVRAKIQMTKTARDLKVHIYEKHLLETKGENALMNDRATVDQEIKNWKKLIKAHLEITRKWAEETSSAELVRDNESIVPEDLSVSAQIPKFIFYHIRVHSFVLVHPYVRGRMIYDRKGRVLPNGLVTFKYPTTESKAKNATLIEEEIQEVGDHWRVLGQSMSCTLPEIKNVPPTLPARHLPDTNYSGVDFTPTFPCSSHPLGSEIYTLVLEPLELNCSLVPPSDSQ